LMGLIVVLIGAADRRIGRVVGLGAVCLALWGIGLGLESVPGFADSHQIFLARLFFGYLILPTAGLHTAIVWSGIRGRDSRIALLSAYGMALILCVLHVKGALFAGFITLPWATVSRPGRLQ